MEEFPTPPKKRPKARIQVKVPFRLKNLKHLPIAPAESEHPPNPASVPLIAACQCLHTIQQSMVWYIAGSAHDGRKKSIMQTGQALLCYAVMFIIQCI